jgi:predicted hydrocarbon binding protein
MPFEKLKLRIRKLTYYLEFLLALFIIIAVVIGMLDLVKYFGLILTTNPIETYDVFQKFLGHVLLMVVGVELVVMLVYHSPSSVIEVLLYAVARKMLIGNQGMIDFILGILAIVAIFGIRKFLFVKDISNGNDSGHKFSAATSVLAINELMKINIPEELGNTIGGVVYKLAHTSGIELYEGLELKISTIRIRIVKIKDGVIEKVSIKASE